MLAKLQYSGATRGLVLGIGMVNLVNCTGAEQDFYPIDYRLFAPDQDSKTGKHNLSMNEDVFRLGDKMSAAKQKASAE